MKISDIMITVTPALMTDRIDQAVAFFLTEDLDILPVADDKGKYVGAVRTKTLLSILKDGAGPLQDMGACLAKDIARFSPHDSLDSVSAEALPAVVLDEENRLLGVVPTKRLTFLVSVNRELESIIDSSYDGIWVMDAQGVILSINKAAERIAGKPAAKYVGRNIRELVKRGLIDQSVSVLVMEKQQRVTINQTAKTASGTAALLVTGNPIFDEEGRLFRIVTNTRDISELIRLRDQLSREKAVARRYLDELAHLRSMQHGNSGLIYRGVTMQRIVELSSRIADVDSTVLVTGESGTGKEMMARLIHRLGRGDKKPFISINCGAIPDQLLESELFGYEGGAFTGARREGKMGMFELAHAGTLFLDEISELPLHLQVKLLMALQNKKIVRVGGTKPIAVEARIIAATNKDLTSMLNAKTFREDLYYRLMVVPIDIPPLRQRREDIPPLVHHFVATFNKHFGFHKTVSAGVMDRLVHYDWPGNVRELKNAVERMMVLSQGDELVAAELPGFMQARKPLPRIGSRLSDVLAETEAVLLAETYKEHGSWQKVADILGIDHSTVYRKVAKYRLPYQR